MKIDEFLRIMQKVRGFKLRLDEEGIVGLQRDIILKVYINDMTNKINTSMLRRGI